MKNIAIIVAAGSGRRMNSPDNVEKIFLPLSGDPLISYTLRAFNSCNMIDEIIIVIKDGFSDKIKDIVHKYNINKINNIVIGGDSRSQSVKNALASISCEEDDVVLVHDGARPFVDSRDIGNVIKSTYEHGAAIIAVPSVGTMKEIDENGFIKGTVDRNKLWEARTPQAFKYGLLDRAYKLCHKGEKVFTDDASIVEELDCPVKVVEGSLTNIKITVPEDLIFAESLLREHKKSIS